MPATPLPAAPLPTISGQTLALLKNSAYPPGVYRFAARAQATPILATITDWGWYAGYINGRYVTNKQTFLNTAGQALAFPTYYGRNWDAFEEMVRDLSWLKAAGYVVLYDEPYRFADNWADEWQTALSILKGASAFWQQEGIPFYVLLRHNGDHNGQWYRDLPKLAV